MELKINEIRQRSRQLVRELDLVKGSYLDTGYTFSQCHVLFELSVNKSLNLLAIADNLLIDKSNASRTVKQLTELGLVTAERVASDNRQKLFSLTDKGTKALGVTLHLANKQVEDALGILNEDQQELVIQGIQLYADALKKSRLQSHYTIRSIQKRDNDQVAHLIRTVMTEFRAVGAGYSIGDSEVDDMYGSYRDKRSCYYVITSGDRVVGCGGLGPLDGGNKFTCEIRKMFFLRETRGIGLGQRLMLLLLNEARTRDYKKCYLETLGRMWRAQELYQKNGFQLLEKPMGTTGHDSCDRWYLLDL
ncbi:MAG: bifunctional helix-turn-helix transcriptional regulator/GNAT family N-acetyltransferase [Pirellulales bacterium]|jgi:putative acetyltransferase